MQTFTNLAWPNDPYRASQQLYRRPSAMLVSFTVLSSSHGGAVKPNAFSLAYLPLQRTRAVSVDERTVAFGFRTVVAESGDTPAPLVELADLDVMQARRHAAVLTGHDLNSELTMLRAAAPDMVTRGLDAVGSEWTDRRERARSQAAMTDTSTDLEGRYDLAALCRHLGIDPSPASLASYPADDGTADGDGDLVERLGAVATERALLIALACARGTGRYCWEAVISTAGIMAATTWDLFPRAISQPTG